MSGIARKIDRLFGLDELSERFFGEGPEGLEKRRRWCAWLSLPSVVVSCAVMVSAEIMLLNLLDGSHRIVGLFLAIPAAGIATAASYVSVLISGHGTECSARHESFMSKVSLVFGAIIFSMCLMFLLVAVGIVLLEVYRYVLPSIGAME
jgi:hypothetical protein